MILNDSMGYLLNLSAKLMKREFDAKLMKHNLTTSQWAVLMVLNQNNGLSQIEIASRLNADKATCGTVIDKLIQKGFIEKRPSDRDKRSYLVFILPNTLTLLDSLSQNAMLCNEVATKGLSDDEIRLYQKFLVTTIQNLGGKLL